MDQKYRRKVMTNLIIGAPLNPTKKKRLKLLSKMLSDLEEVREAHLPQVNELGSNEPPELIFFVVIDPEHDRWRSVNGTFGVRHLITQGNQPLPVPISVIESLKCMED